MRLSRANTRKLRKIRVLTFTPVLTFARDRRGVAVLELALTLPVLLTLMFGILTGGAWLAMSNAVQLSANEGARAALVGLTQNERATLATDAARSTLSRSYGVSASAVTVTVQDDGQRLTVVARYDGSANPLLSLPIVPAQTKTIERRTTMLLAGL